jgi:U3 small nucleolar RNA-associated protein 20
MPSVINALDITNAILVDKIFTLMSFGVKYLTKSIKDDLENFYQIYIEMLSHRNKFVKKFAAQSFCYVLRKLPFDHKLLSIIFKPAIENESQHAQRLDVEIGISELLFEVVYGASEGLHSRAKELLHEVLK